MKARVISNDTTLTDLLKTTYQVAVKNKPTHLSNVIEDFVVVDESILSVDDILNALNDNIPIFFVTQQHKPLESDMGSVIVVHKNNVLEQIKNYFSDEHTFNNVMTFYGTLSGIGTTNIAISIAKEFAKKGNTCLLSLTFKPGLEYIDKSYHPSDGGLARLLPHLVANTLTEKEFENVIVEHEKISYMYGIKSLQGLMTYEIEHIEALIAMASRLYDHVIIDAGSGGWMTRLAIAALKVSGQKNLVVTSQPRSQQAWDNIQETIECLGIKEKFQFIISPYMRKVEMTSERQIKRNYEAVYIGTIDYVAGVGIEAEMKQKPIAELSKGGNKQIQALAIALERGGE
jgi:hypothetical protein